MLFFLRPRNEKDLGDKLLGKTRRYRLSRNGATVTVTGRLLAYYAPVREPDGLMPPVAGRVDLLAIFLTRSGRFLVYYTVSYPETEDIPGCHEYVQVCSSLEAVRAFLAAMHYPNRGEFTRDILARAARMLAGDRAEAAPAEPGDTGTVQAARMEPSPPVAGEATVAPATPQPPVADASGPASAPDA